MSLGTGKLVVNGMELGPIKDMTVTKATTEWLYPRLLYLPGTLKGLYPNEERIVRGTFKCAEFADTMFFVAPEMTLWMDDVMIGHKCVVNNGVLDVVLTEEGMKYLTEKFAEQKEQR